MKIWPDGVYTSLMSVSGELKPEDCCEDEGSVGSMLSSFLPTRDHEVISQTKRQSKSSQTAIPQQQ